jgi:uncharacterized protein YecE (DUF72 family)
MQLWTGTSGYSYPDWVGPFYPPGVRGPRMLDYYAQLFPLVELNFTFYRLPTPAMLARLVERAPHGFQFLIKLPRTISHEQSSREIVAFQQAVVEVQRRHGLMGLLCQMPQSAHQSKGAWQWLQQLFGAFAGFGLAVEFRHRSWATPDVAERLREAGVDLVSVDVPALPDLYPAGLVQSTDRVYVRLHSRRAEHWYLSDKERYDYDYGDRDLHEWIDAIARAEERTRQVMVLFNNCHRGQAAANAVRFQNLAKELRNSWEIMPALAPRSAERPHQGLLFE